MSQNKQATGTAPADEPSGLVAKKITRRAFAKRAAAMAFAVPAVASIWNHPATAAGPKQGGTLRQALRGGATSDSLDGAALIDTHNINTSWQVRNNLTEIDANGDLVGELAQSWDNSPDAIQWVFRLRKGVEFHNGKSLDAQDVIDSVNNHRGPDSKSGAKALLDAIVDIKADGKDTVVFKLREGNVDFPWILSDYHVVIGIAGTKGPEWDKGIGTGPFTLTEWKPGVRSATKRNPNYFKSNLPYFDEVVTLNVADQNARETALISGQVDAIEEPDLRTLDLLAKNPKFRIGEGLSGSHTIFPMMVDRPPFDNNDVRLALKHACNRQALLETVAKGHGYVGNDHPIGRKVPFFDSQLPQQDYDIDKAKFHLRKAGHSTLDLTLYAADAAFPGAVDSATLLKEYMAPAGINITVARMADDGYWSNVWMQKDWCAGHWIGRPTADSMFSIAYVSDAAWNETHWKNPQFDKLVKLARAELDHAKRQEMYFELQTMTRDEGGALIPAFLNYVCAHSSKIGRPDVIGANLDMDGDKNTERWWFT